MFDVVLERRFVAAAMIDPSILDKAGVGLDHITSGPERQVLECLFALRDRDEEPNEESLEVEFSRRGYTHLHGVSPYDWASHSADPGAIAARLRELADARSIHDIARQIQAACERGAPSEAREHMRSMWDLRQTGSSESRVKTLRAVWQALGEHLVNSGPDNWPGLGWPDVDKQVRLQPGQLLVLGAQTNVGKTTALTTWAMNLAGPKFTNRHSKRSVPVGLISVEDGDHDFGAKWMGRVVGTNPSDIFFGHDRERVHARFGRALKDGAADVPIYFSAVMDRSLDSVLMDMSYMRQRHGVEVVMVDYLQAISLPAGTRDIRTGTNHVLSQLIAQAGRLGVCLILASQLSRPPKEKPFREPTKHDLKESGDVENRAQAIVMLWKGDPAECGAHEVKGKVEKVKQTALDSRPFSLFHMRGALMPGDTADYDAAPSSREFADD